MKVVVTEEGVVAVAVAVVVVMVVVVIAEIIAPLSYQYFLNKASKIGHTAVTR